MTLAPLPAVGIAVEGVTLSYGAEPVLRDISLDIAPGEFFALLGPSGSGKSTLLRLLAGFNRAQAGRVRIGGADVADLPPWKRDVGMVFQNYALWPHLTVAQNVAFGLEERRWPRPRIDERVREMLDLVGLAAFAARRPGQLSGGQQQRVAIARTLAIAPRVLLLDEPLSNLDAKLRASTGLELKRLQRRLGVTTVFVTHDQQEAMTIADRLAVLDHGVIQQAGSPRELYDAPVNRFVAEFVGSINLFPGRVERADGPVRRLDVGGLGTGAIAAHRVDARIADGAADALIAFRPHAVRLAGGAADEGLAFDAEVAAVEFLGEFVRYELRAGTVKVTADLPHARHEPALPAGHRARFAVPSGEILVLALN
ncbi:MAG TPA: ABC transporter ATP-binding protein [Casimicrobiaceae bacterium]|nr:ABC transporter ATP-binding protein [Casimicrobiaceae bacterium]